MSGEQNEYEAERARRIAENRAKMAELGLVQASSDLASTVDVSYAGPRGPSFSDRGPRSKQRKPSTNKKTAAPAARIRESKRLRGYTAPPPDAAAAKALEEAAAEAAAAPAPGPLGTTSKGNPRKALSIPPNTTFSAPFSLQSIGTTVWELGSVHRGPWAQRYWSNRGCLFHHAYPVGYRATKEIFGREYEMRIEAGPTGPIFSVKDSVTGASPTKPWTDVCIAHRTGQRISGPLFFGFSDPITQKAIATCLYNERELAAALIGETVQAEELTPEEISAKEFAALDGIGETTAMVLARTEALGGCRHSGVASLRAWVSENEENSAILLKFLLTSEEMPEATRRWPAWTDRIAARIVAILQQNEEKGGPVLTGNEEETMQVEAEPAATEVEEKKAIREEPESDSATETLRENNEGATQGTSEGELQESAVSPLKKIAKKAIGPLDRYFMQRKTLEETTNAV